MCRVFSCLAFVSLLASSNLIAAEPSASSNWPQFRGPQLDGHSVSQDVPLTWNASQVQWSTALPAQGHSSPAVWGDNVYLTGSKAQTGSIHRYVFCVSLSTGKVLWSADVAAGEGESLHKMNSWATPTCATDGEHVVAFFGPGGLHCLDTKGRVLWSRQLGEFPGNWGIGASPIIIDNLVIQNCDATGDSSIVALDLKSGQEVWRTSRREKPRGGWSTPVLLDESTLLLNGEFGVQAYAPASGKPLWSCNSFNGRGTPAPVFGHGLIYVVNGKPGDVYAIRPGGAGDVTDSHMAWHTERRGGRDLPSPVLLGQTLVVISMGGVVTGYDARGGEELWKERLGGNFSGSPIVARKHVLAAAEDGTVFAFEADKQFKLLGKTRLNAGDDEVFRSSLAVAGDRLLIRSDKKLYCVAANQ